MPPDKPRTRPSATRTGSHKISSHHATKVRVQREPVPLAEAVADLIEWSDALDASLRLQLSTYRAGYTHGFEQGVAAGRREAEAEQARSWYAVAHPIAHGISYDELERRRWGPGGREHFCDPRPGDHGGSAA